MSCEQKDPDKEWNKRMVNLVNQKNSFLENPELFLKEVWREASYFLAGVPPDWYLENVCLKATSMLTGVMRSEELTTLINGLEKIRIREVEGLPGNKMEIFKFKSVINSLMTCQDARRVSCVKMVPDL